MGICFFFLSFILLSRRVISDEAILRPRSICRCLTEEPTCNSQDQAQPLMFSGNHVSPRRSIIPWGRKEPKSDRIGMPSSSPRSPTCHDHPRALALPAYQGTLQSSNIDKACLNPWPNSTKLVVLVLDLDLQQPLVVIPLLPRPLQDPHLVLLEPAPGRLLQLPPADLGLELLLL